MKMNTKSAFAAFAFLVLALGAFVIVSDDASAEPTQIIEVKDNPGAEVAPGITMDLITVIFNNPVTGFTQITVTDSDGNVIRSGEVNIDNSEKASIRGAPLGDTIFTLVANVNGVEYTYTNVEPSEDATVTYMVDGVVLTTQPVVKGETITSVPDAPAKTGFEAPYWSATVDGEEFDFTTAITADITLYAVYKPIVTEVVFDHIVVDASNVPTFTVGEAPVYSALVITAYYSDDSTKVLSVADVVIDDDAVDSTQAGVYNVTVSYTEDDVTDFETFTVTYVAAPVDPQEDPAKRTFNNTITLGDGAVIDERSYINASYTQEVIISGDVTVIAGGYIFINGKLTIAEGATLTVETGGKIIVEEYGIVDVKGDLIVEGGQDGYSFLYYGIVMTVSGEVDLEGTDSFLSNGKGIEVSGLFVVGDDATAYLEGATITKDGKLLITGVATGTVTNNGEVTIDSQGLENGKRVGLTIQLGAEGTVDAINVYGIVDITDDALTFTQGKNTYDAKYDNSVTLINVAGVKVTETLKVTEKDGKYTGTNTMNVAGTIVTAVDYNATVESGAVHIYGDNVATSGDVVLGDNIAMNIHGKLTVTSKLDAIADGSEIFGDGEMTVEGKVTVKTVAGVEKINAAKYTTASPAYIIYTTLETALNDGATVIALMGENTVAADATIPVGTTVTMDAGSKLTVSDKATLTVAADERNSARFNTAGVDTVDVKGTLVVVNFAKSKVTEASILSDTAKTVEKTRTYTNIYNALAAASEGETVEITRGADLKLTKDVEVKQGITLSIPAGEKVIVDNGVTVTVNGTVYVAGDYVITPEVKDDESTAADESKPAGATAVNGLFLYADDEADYTEDIVGAYFDYSYTVGKNTVVVNAIAPLASVPGIMDKVESDYIIIFGEMTVGTIDFSAYEGDHVVLASVDKFNFDTITIGTSVMYVAYGGSATGTIVLANGTVDVKNVNGFVAYNETDADEVTTSYFEGQVDSYDNPETTTVVEKGSVSFTGAVTVAFDATKNVSVDIPADVTVTVNGGVLSGAVTVEGAMVINGTGIVFQDLTVTGTVTAEKKNVAQAVKLFVGVTSEDFAKAGTGSVAGVTLVNSASAVAYVSPNATVGEDITELKSTEYYVEDALYLTAYAVAGNAVEINGVKFTVQNAWFDAWTYTKDDKSFEIASEVVGDASKVYADIEYEIFTVRVIVDAGIGAVAIDGNVLKNETGNVFKTTTPLKAGQYTVICTLKTGYTGTAKLSVNGEGATVSGNNVTLSGTPEDEDGIIVELSLFGTEVADPSITIDVPTQPTDKDEGLGLTDILLIVLVILAAILVVVVAIRMMRS